MPIFTIAIAMLTQFKNT